MNEFGEPNMGNPSVRFDEGRESLVTGFVPYGLTLLPTLQVRPSAADDPEEGHWGVYPSTPDAKELREFGTLPGLHTGPEPYQ